MLSLVKSKEVMQRKTDKVFIHNSDNVIIFSKGKNTFAFNFHPQNSYDGYFVQTKYAGEYKAVLSTDEEKFVGFNRVDMNYIYKAEKHPDGRCGFFCYLPSRTATAFEKI